MNILDKIATVTGGDIAKAMQDSFDAMVDMLNRPSFPKPFETDMTMEYTKIHYVKDGVYAGNRIIPWSLGEANEAQEAMPDCVLWREYSSGWHWWYHGGTINHWRKAHDEVQPVPEILKMMKLMGAL